MTETWRGEFAKLPPAHLEERHLTGASRDLPPVEAGRRLGLREASAVIHAIRLAGKAPSLEELSRMLDERADK